VGMHIVEVEVCIPTLERGNEKNVSYKFNTI